MPGYLAGSKRQFADAFAGFTAHSYRSMKFQGRDATWMEHSYDGTNGRVREVVMTAFIDQPHFDLPLQFVLESPAADFKKNLATFRKILDSAEVDNQAVKGNVKITYV